jgi:hypothetical protein
MAAAKRVELRVVGDAVQTRDGEWHYNGEELSVSEAEAKELVAAGTAVKVPDVEEPPAGA